MEAGRFPHHVQFRRCCIVPGRNTTPQFIPIAIDQEQQVTVVQDGRTVLSSRPTWISAIAPDPSDCLECRLAVDCNLSISWAKRKLDSDYRC